MVVKLNQNKDHLLVYQISFISKIFVSWYKEQKTNNSIRYKLEYIVLSILMFVQWKRFDLIV